MNTATSTTLDADLLRAMRNGAADAFAALYRPTRVRYTVSPCCAAVPATPPHGDQDCPPRRGRAPGHPQGSRSRQERSKDLGTRDFNGVKAEGKLRSYEIPAGEIGNRNPIVVSDETWYASELQITVYTRHSDPRSGDTVFRLDGLKREEPAAGLFAAPSDYTVKEPLAGLAARADKGAKAQ